MENISHIKPFERMLPWNRVSPAVQRKKKRKKKPDTSPGRHFYTLSQLVDDTHLNLIAKESSLRLCVYRKNKEVFMDVVTLDETKKIDQLYNRTITHDDMGNLLRQIHNGMGLILDYSV
jgi:hypothetical protein